MSAGWVQPPSVFGTELHTATRIAPVGTSLAPASAVIYLSLGSAENPVIIPAGTYQGITSFFAGVDTANNEIWVDVLINSSPSPFGASIYKVGSAGSQKPVTAVNIQTFPETTPIWFDLAFARQSGAGDVTMYQATFVLHRIS